MIVVVTNFPFHHKKLDLNLMIHIFSFYGIVVVNNGGIVIVNNGGIVTVNDGGIVVVNDGGIVAVNDGGIVAVNDGGIVVVIENEGYRNQHMNLETVVVMNFHFCHEK